MRFADTAVIVTNPEVSSVRDSDRIIGLLDAKTEKAEKGQRVDKHILITRYDGARAARGEMLTIEDVLEILSTPLLGIIPESQEVLRASNLGSPVTLSDPASGPARAYLDAARRLKGEAVPMAIPGDRKRPARSPVWTEGRMNLLNLCADAAPLRWRGSDCRSCLPTSGPVAAIPTSSQSCARRSSR